MCGLGERIQGNEPSIRQYALLSLPKTLKVKVPNKESFEKALKAIPPAKRVTYHRHKIKGLGLIARK